MTLQNIQFQQETGASIQSLTNQIGQMVTQLNQAQSQNSDRSPSQTVQNPKNVSVITLRVNRLMYLYQLQYLHIHLNVYLNVRKRIILRQQREICLWETVDLLPMHLLPVVICSNLPSLFHFLPE